MSLQTTGLGRDIVVVTGMSGAGKSVTLRTLEDLGYEAIDNIPLSLVGAIISEAPEGAEDYLPARRPLAIGLDIRTRDFEADAIRKLLAHIEQANGVHSRILFLDCDDVALQRRYTETRRRHPLAMDRPLVDGIMLEREILAPLRSHASDLIDTTELPSNTLRNMLAAKYGDTGIDLHVFVVSFSFRRGIPREADLVFDVRFLRNPYYDEALRDCTGREHDVQNYIAEDPDFASFIANLETLLRPLLPRYRAEGKSYLTLAVGCTGGRHRSVFVAERLGLWLREQNHEVSVRHRELQIDDGHKAEQQQADK